MEYYPFGLNQTGDWYATISPENKYQYNGKELDTDLGLNWIDYGARYYDPAIGRWGQIDPHAENYTPFSPYNYVLNNPINTIDPDGRDIFILTWFTSKGHVGHAGIAVENYKTVNKKDAAGNDVLDSAGNVVTEQVKDGTYTYYDLWPKDPVGNTEMQTDVDAGYSEGILINNLNELKNTDVTTQVNGNVHSEGRPADGIVQIGSSYSQDEAAKAYAEDQIAKGTKYNACSNNCSTFTQNVANQALGRQINASQTLKPPFALRMFGYKTTSVVAPNNLYNAALKVKGATRVRGPKQADVSKSYLDLYKGN